MTIQEMIRDYFDGRLDKSYHLFGAHFTVDEGLNGVRFTVYAPHAKNIQVVGDFNCYDGWNHWMEKIDNRGIWQLFISNIGEHSSYKYNIETEDKGWILKSDPYAFYSEKRPATASVLTYIKDYQWSDERWIEERKEKTYFDKPLNIYELHLGSWMKKGDDDFYSYEDFVSLLIPYVKAMAYTHVELMPLSEHPFDGSWGYQVTGYFSATSRFGDPKKLMYLIDQLHQNDIGVIMDWVPVHFCKDDHGLIEFDGKPLYEYPFADLIENEQWGTRQFDLGNPQVKQFLISSANFWIDYYHLDGIRVDAVSYIIYFKGDESRGQNEHGIQFLKDFNSSIHHNFPGVLSIAEDSSSFSKVTEPVFNGGLGFDFKWDLGWMNDTLKFMSQTPHERTLNYAPLTFGMMYRYSEKYILPFSHDEVVHGKKSMLDKMPGNQEEKFSNLRLLLGYMYAYPSKMLNFMGTEFGQYTEWDEDKQIEWELKEYPIHNGLTRFVNDLNNIYKFNESLFSKDGDLDGFVWSEVNKPEEGVYSFIRRGYQEEILVVCNFMNRKYYDYKVGVLTQGTYREILNSDASIYGGDDNLNKFDLNSINENVNGKDYCLQIGVPPLSVLFFKKID